MPTGPETTQHPPDWYCEFCRKDLSSPEAPSWPGRLHHTREPRGGGRLLLPHPLPDAAQVVHFPAGQALEQELPTVMPRRPLQLGSVLGYPPAPDPPAPKPGPETAYGRSESVCSLVRSI